jgi:1,4-alpha-glucan branching enzyme
MTLSDRFSSERTPSDLAPGDHSSIDAIDWTAAPATINILPREIHGGVHHDLILPDTVTFALRAPHKPYVSLVGDFNGWDTLANPLVTDGRGTWWATLAHPGPTRYGYFVAIDEQSHTWVGDPYATQVRWDDDAAWAYLPEKQEPFVWTDQRWQTPALRDMVIYELNVRDFAGKWEQNRPKLGNFRAMMDRVDYLADLGINAIELMPIQAFPGRSSWGYNPVFYFSLADVYGSPADLKRFVDYCHARGIAVILDVAFNHAWGDHPYYHYYPPMYDEDGERLTNWNPFFHHTPQAVNMWGGLDWNHFSPDTTRYFQDIVRFWLTEYHLDGFRFDWVCGVDYDDEQPMRPGFHPYHGIGAICWAARETKPDCVLLGEFWQLDGTHPDKTAAKLIRETEMDAAWSGRFHHTLENVINQRWQWECQDIRRAIGGYDQDGFDSPAQLINFTCSHDEVRPEHEIKFYSGRHIDLPEEMTLQQAAIIKAQLGLVLLFTAPGVPMIYAGQEFAEDTPRTIDFLPLNWEKLETPMRMQHVELVRRLIQLRQTHEALRSDNIQFHGNGFAEEKLLCYDRWLGEPGSSPRDFVAIALNFDNVPKGVSLKLPYPGSWLDIISGRKHRLRRNQVRLTLKPWDSAVLVPVTGTTTGTVPSNGASVGK